MLSAERGKLIPNRDGKLVTDAYRYKLELILHNYNYLTGYMYILRLYNYENHEKIIMWWKKCAQKYKRRF